MGVEAGEPLHPGVDPDCAIQGVEDARFNGMGGVERIGTKAEAEAAILAAVIFEEEGIGQHGQNPADLLFVVVILLAMLCLLAGRVEEELEPGLLLLFGFRGERVAVGEGESGDGTLAGLNLILEARFLLEPALNPVAPVAVVTVVVELVVDDLADELRGRDGWLRLGLCARGELGQNQKPRGYAKQAHSVAAQAQV